MTSWNLGSVQEHVGAIVGWTNVPTSVSGTVLNNMVSQEINFVETYTTDTISDNSISSKYQPAVIDLVMSKLLLSIDTQEKGIDKISLSDLSVSQGGQSNKSLAKQLREDAIRRLKELSRTVRFTQSIGG